MLAARPARPAPPARGRCRSASFPRRTRPRAGRLRERGPQSARVGIRVTCSPSACGAATAPGRSCAAPGLRRCAPLTGMPCSMARTRRPPPAALQKAVRYAACGALPASLSVSYRHTLLCRCCGGPGAHLQVLPASAAGRGYATVRTCEDSASALSHCPTTAAPDAKLRSGRLAGALVSHRSSVVRPGLYCVQKADVAASPHTSDSSTSHQ